jgi:KipI family sensor histidine kinase inhibitor
VSGLYARFATTLDERANAALHACARRLIAAPPSGVRDVYPGLGSVYVEWDDARVARAVVERWLRAALRPQVDDEDPPAAVTVPVRYDGEDLEAVAAMTGRTAPGVVDAHCRREYRVLAVGAAPGQPFLGVDDDPAVPRRANPRLAVPAHAVALAQRQTTIYPVRMPGGWNVIGRATIAAYDPNRAEPFLLRPGDRVRFRAVDGDPPPQPAALELLPGAVARPALRVEETGPLDLVLDAGRFNHAHLGMAQSGPVDAPAAARANLLVGNPPGATLVETTLGGPTLTALTSTVVAVTGAGAELQLHGTGVGTGPVPVRAGTTLRVRGRAQGVRGYLAIAGGIAAQTFLGSTSVDLRGCVGRPLRAGDVIAEACSPRAPGCRAAVDAAAGGPIRLLPGPQHSRAAERALTAGTFTVGPGDRMGVRLEGPQVPGGEVLSESPPLGAVQVTSDGTPIVLLNDRQRSAGYAKPAVVHPEDLPRFAQLRPGATVRFTFPETPRRGWYLDIDESDTEEATWS